MKRKLLSIILCSVMLASCICGCSKDTSTVDTDILNSLNHMTFHEVGISFPCKFKELSDNFTLSNGFYFGETDYTFYDLLYQGNKVASVAIDGEKTEENNDKEVVVIIIEDEQLANLEITGASCDVDIDTMIDRLGKPDSKSVGDWKSFVSYITDSVEFSITFNDNQAYEIKFLKKRKAD